MKHLLSCILLLLVLMMSGCNQEQKLELTYRKSVKWLWEQQGGDGGWHSNTHAVLRDGHALTPYILFYLLQVPDNVYPKNEKAIAKAVAFIQKNIEESFAKSREDGIELNYPNYSAAYALRVLNYLQVDTLLQDAIASYLLSQQFIEHRGIHPDHLAYGGWGYGEPNLKPGDCGHVDLSHTRRITQALMESGYLDSQRNSTMKLAMMTYENDHDKIGLQVTDDYPEIRLFLQGVQRAREDSRLYEGCTDRTNIPYDGGFVSSMYTLSTNKCQPYNVNDCYHYPSYATATCDGLIAMHALGMQQTDAYEDAKRWLAHHQRIDAIDGLSEDDPEQWYQVMHYYHWSVRAEAMSAAGIEGRWENDLRKSLVKEQREDGSYINPLGGVNKEDDPMMATIFCIQAMTFLKTPG